MAFLNVNSDAVVKYTDKLERSSRSALPVAVRQTLNGAAFKSKKSLPTVTKHKFTIRSKGFFNKFSTVQQAKGFNLSTMKSTIGFLPADPAVMELEAQEFGGQIKNRSFIPMDTARTSKNHGKNVRRPFRVGELKSQGITHIRKTGKGSRSKFIRAAFEAGKGGFVFYGNTLFRVDRINNKAKGRGKIKLTPLYNYKKGRAVKIKATKFMAQNSTLNARKMDRDFINNAKKQFEKIGLL